MKFFSAFIILLALWFQSTETISNDNLQTIAPLGELGFEDSWIRDLAFSSDNNTIFLARRPTDVSLGLNGEIILVNIEDLTDIQQTAYPEILGNTLTFSPDGTLFAVGTKDGEIEVFDAETLELIKSFQGSLDIVNDLAISPDNTYIGATFAIPSIEVNDAFAFRLFSLNTGDEIVSYPLNDTTFGIYGAGVTFNESGDYVFFSTSNFSSQSGQVFAYEISTGVKTLLGEGNAPNGRKLIYHPDNNALYYMGLNEMYLTFPFSEESPVDDFIVITHEGDTSMVNFALHPSEPLLAVKFSHTNSSGEFTEIVRFYNSETGEELSTILESGRTFFPLEFSPDGTLLATVSEDGVMRLWGIPNEDE